MVSFRDSRIIELWLERQASPHTPIAPPSQKNPSGETLVFPVPPGDSLPRWPASGVRSEKERAKLLCEVVPETGIYQSPEVQAKREEIGRAPTL